MQDREIYKLWLSKVKDHRYLRPPRWEELKKVLLKYGVKNVLEFGSGVSTLLMSNLGIRVVSFETDPFYLEFVQGLKPARVIFKLHNNVDINISGRFDLAFIDGTLPRKPQLQASLPLTDLIAIDDFGPKYRREFTELLSGYTRLNPSSPLMAIFKSVQKSD